MRKARTINTQKGLDSSRINSFKKTIWSYYHKHKRAMPWRDNTSPYYVVVSEIMLQQTQVDRVMKKFPSFISHFPDWKTLAQANTKDVLTEWSGLGYNRRALFLKRIAETITKGGTIEGTLPRTTKELSELPGIGPNTAGSILAVAYNISHPFIETNIRSVFIHHFFSKETRKIHDTEIIPLIEHTRVTNNPREWYYALMDYGSYIKKNMINPSRKSTHHIKQTPFKGSNRELRSKILKTIMSNPQSEQDIITAYNSYSPQKIHENLDALVREGFIQIKRRKYCV